MSDQRVAGKLCGRSFAFVRHHVHRPDVAEILLPSEVEVLAIRGERVDSRITSLSTEIAQRSLRFVLERHDPDIAQAQEVDRRPNRVTNNTDGASVFLGIARKAPKNVARALWLDGVSGSA